MATAIEIINAACHELGLPTVSLSGATGDTLGSQSLALLNALGQELVRVHDWQFLEKIMVFTGDGIQDKFPVPIDFGRQVNQTQWATKDRRPLMGPDSAKIWSWSQYGIVGPGIYYRYRILGNEYTLFPVPGPDAEFALYYISKNWVQDELVPTEFKSACTLPGDVPLFDERLMITGLKVKLWGQKGFDTTIIQDEFNFMLAAVKAQNQGARVIDLTGDCRNLYISWTNIPESGYGG